MMRNFGRRRLAMRASSSPHFLLRSRLVMDGGRRQVVLHMLVVRAVLEHVVVLG
jgi:hypothetical protein